MACVCCVLAREGAELLGDLLSPDGTFARSDHPRNKQQAAHWKSYEVSPYNQTMCLLQAACERLSVISNAQLLANAVLAPYTRFAIGGPAALLFDTDNEAALLEALRIVAGLKVTHVLIGGGTNLVVSDNGFHGVVLRYRGAAIRQDECLLRVEAGAVLQDIVDHSMDLGLQGLQTMTGIPGYLGGAVYGNAGAYGHSIQEIVQKVRFFNGEEVVAIGNEACGFRYRTSVFKENKNWIILSADLKFSKHEAADLRRTAAEIRAIRDAKYPPAMRCAGSIFKNLLVAELPPGVPDQIPKTVIREGKIPSAWFLEQVGAKGMRRGDIQVATYHANLIYNDGAGRAADLVSVIQELKSRVRDGFGLELEEEVQYVGFDS